MSKNKIFVCDVLSCAGDLDAAVVLVEDGEATRGVQICVPKYCDISKYIGEEIYYEAKSGRVRLSAIRSPKHEVDNPIQDIESGEEQSLPFFCFAKGDGIEILSVDQARNGAWTVSDYGTKRLETYGTFSFGNKDYTRARATPAIESLIDTVIEAYNISTVLIGDIQLYVNVQPSKKLAQPQGVLINLFEKNECLYDFITPTQWQNYCKAKGRGSKKIRDKIKALEASRKKESKILSTQTAKEMYRIDIGNDNPADTIMVGYFIINNYDIRLNQDNQIRIKKHEKQS